VGWQEHIVFERSSATKFKVTYTTHHLLDEGRDSPKILAARRSAIEGLRTIAVDALYEGRRLVGVEVDVMSVDLEARRIRVMAPESFGGEVIDLFYHDYLFAD
jgi:hypothetical protein